MIIHVTNHGPLITVTNFWESPLAERGLLFCSVNAGAIRILLPRSRYADLEEMRTGEYCILSRGPWPQEQKPEGIEIMWEDRSDSPYALHLDAESFDLLPGEPQAGREWVLSVWTQKDGAPHKAMDRICHWRRVPRLPWLRPWDGGK